MRAGRLGAGRRDVHQRSDGVGPVADVDRPGFGEVGGVGERLLLSHEKVIVAVLGRAAVERHCAARHHVDYIAMGIPGWMMPIGGGAAATRRLRSFFFVPSMLISKM